MRTSFVLVAASVVAILSAASAFPEAVTVERTIDKVVRPVEGKRTVSDVTRIERGSVVTDVPQTTPGTPTDVVDGVVDGTFTVVEPTRVPKTVIQTEETVRNPRMVPVPTEVVRDVVGSRFVTVDTEGTNTEVVQDVVREPVVTPVPTKVVRDVVGTRFVTVDTEGKTTEVVQDVVREPVVTPVPTKVVRDVFGNRFITVDTEGKATDVVGTIRGDSIVGPTFTTIPHTLDSTGFIRVVEPIIGEGFVATIDRPVVTRTPVHVVPPVTVGRVADGLNRLTRFVEVDPTTVVPTTRTGIVVDRFTDTVSDRSLRSPFRVAREVVIPAVKERD